ncbi:hypothetical protein FJTKL_11679 [Diaporthe vaccinii]|uniref:Uncharacterized protein n=1 Tax=Diaporthe vaccinii TaxID=105482 RepID=A0ABR4EFK8_9PEZI
MAFKRRIYLNSLGVFLSKFPMTIIAFCFSDSEPQSISEAVPTPPTSFSIYLLTSLPPSSSASDQTYPNGSRQAFNLHNHACGSSSPARRGCLLRHYL